VQCSHIYQIEKKMWSQLYLNYTCSGFKLNANILKILHIAIVLIILLLIYIILDLKKF